MVQNSDSNGASRSGNQLSGNSEDGVVPQPSIPIDMHSLKEFLTAQTQLMQAMTKQIQNITENDMATINSKKNTTDVPRSRSRYCSLQCYQLDKSEDRFTRGCVANQEVMNHRKSSIECYNCRRKGHYANRCPQKRQIFPTAVDIPEVISVRYITPRVSSKVAREIGRETKLKKRRLGKDIIPINECSTKKVHPRLCYICHKPEHFAKKVPSKESNHVSSSQSQLCPYRSPAPMLN